MLTQEGYEERFWRRYPRLRDCFRELELGLNSPLSGGGPTSVHESLMEGLNRALSVAFSLQNADREKLTRWLAEHLGRDELESHHRALISEIDDISSFLEKIAQQNRGTRHLVHECFGGALDEQRRSQAVRKNPSSC